MASSEIIGGPFSSDVRTQLTRRQSVQKDNNRSSQELQHLNSRTAWVKMVSSVEDSSEKNLAKKNILAGGLQGYSGIKSYTLGDKGYRPSPGITGMQVTSVGRFGLLREATVNFNCWDVEQLEDLEKLFMRPGFSVLLEWGNTYYIDKDGNFSTVIPSVADLMITPPGSSAGQTRRDAIQKVIREKRAQSGYNYDAILGVIKNFSWKFRPDGGYDCTTVIVSSGEIVQSLTVDVDVDTVGKTGEVDPVKKAETPTMLNAIIREIEEGTAESIWTSVESLYPDFALKYKTLSPTGGTIVSGKYQLQDGTNFSYIRMDSLLNILNTVIVCDKDKNPLFRFFTDITSSKIKTSFRTYSYHTSSDPGTCLISGASVDNWKCGQTFEFLDTLRTLNQGIEDNNILGIWVSTNLIKDAIKTLLGDSTKQNRSVVNFIKPILGKISEALGSCNSLDLHYEEEESTYYVIDRNFKEKTTYPEISVTGLKSTTTDFDFTSKLTPNLTGMLAISAQADLPESGIDIENFFEWNKGLTDRVLGSKVIKTTSTSTEASNNREADQQKRYDIVYSNLGNFFVNKVYNLNTAESAKNSYADFTRDFNYLYNEYVTDAGPKGIIPFEGTITMDGISGIKIGQVFKINTGVMPKKYDKIVGFTVTGVDHVIQNNRWYTKLKAQTTIVEYSKKKSNFPGTFKCATLPTLLMNIGTGASIFNNPFIAGNTVDTIVGGGDVDLILATIRQKETGGKYTSLNFAWDSGASTASGAYQFTGRSWRTYLQDYYSKNKIQNGQTYTFAYQAPSQLQDAVARMVVEDILAKNGNSLRAVPNIWYTGNAQGILTPKQLAVNNGLTSDMYYSQWIKVYNELKATGKFVTTVQGMQDFNNTQTPNIFNKKQQKQNNVFTKLDNPKKKLPFENRQGLDPSDPWGLKKIKK